MNLPVQSLPPGWRIEARSPKSRGFEDCSIRIINPDGEEILFLAQPYEIACEVTRQLEDALSQPQTKAIAS